METHTGGEDDFSPSVPWALEGWVKMGGLTLFEAVGSTVGLTEWQ